MFESIKKLTADQPLGKTSENAKRIAAAIVLEKAAIALRNVFGEDAAENMDPVTFRNGKLTIQVKHGVWAQDIVLRQSEMIEAINSEFNQQLVKKITTR